MKLPRITSWGTIVKCQCIATWGTTVNEPLHCSSKEITSGEERAVKYYLSPFKPSQSQCIAARRTWHLAKSEQPNFITGSQPPSDLQRQSKWVMIHYWWIMTKRWWCESTNNEQYLWLLIARYIRTAMLDVNCTPMGFSYEMCPMMPGGKWANLLPGSEKDLLTHYGQTIFTIDTSFN